MSFQAIITAVGSGLGLANGGLGQVIAGFGDETNPASIIGGLSALAAGVGAQGNFDCPPYAHLPTALHATDPASGCTVATPGAAATSLEAGLAQISAGIGTGTEFNGSTPLTVQAIINAVNGGIDQIAAGVGSSSAPGTVINALTSLGAGLGNQQSFDCPPYTPQPVGSATAPFGSPTTPDPYQKGKCDESTTGTKPGSAESAIAQIKSVLATIDTGVGAIVSGIGDLDKNGNAVKAVTAPRRSQFGTLVQDPASLQYGLSLIHDGFNGVFTGFGSRSVKAATVLGGLQQISDGLVTGINGAATVSGVVKTGVVSSDQYAAFQNAGAKRATNYPPFVSAPPNASNTTMFLYRLPAIG